MPSGTRVDPYRGYNFLLEIDGIPQAGFQEASGLDSSTGSIDYREGTDPNHVRRLTGLTQYSAISLKLGVTDSDGLWKWRQSVVDGRPQRKNGSVVLLDDTGAEQIRWNFINAWPSKWTGPAFNVTGPATAIETLEITHEELKKA